MKKSRIRNWGNRKLLSELRRNAAMVANAVIALPGIRRISQRLGMEPMAMNLAEMTIRHVKKTIAGSRRM